MGAIVPGLDWRRNPLELVRARARRFPELSRLTKLELAFLMSAIAVAAALRFATLSRQSYWFDEAVTVDVVRRSFVGMLHAIPQTESTPPLYYVLAWAWSRLFGTSENGLRSLSALVGTATVPAAYAAARVLTSRRTALVTAVLVAVSPILIWYSQEARAYALLAFLEALALLFFARALSHGDTRSLGWWSLTAAGCVATHYVAVFFIAPQGVWLLVRWRRRRAGVVGPVAVAAAGLILLPLAVHQERSGRTAWIHRNPLSGRLRETAHQFVAGYYPLPHGTLIAVAAAALVVAGLSTLVCGRDRRGAVVALVIAATTLALPLALAVASYGIGGHGDYLFFRNLLGAWVPLAIAAAAALAATSSPAIVTGAATIVAAMLVIPTLQIDRRPNLQRDDWRGVARALGPPRRDRVIAVTPGYNSDALRHYRPRVTPRQTSGRSITQIVLVVPGAGTTLPGFTPPALFVHVRRRVVQHFALVYLDGPATHGVTEQTLFPSQENKPSVTVVADAGLR